MTYYEFMNLHLLIEGIQSGIICVLLIYMFKGEQ
jgi:hypothetical protein